MPPRHPSITPSPRPYPNAADREEAARFIDAEYADVPEYLALHRATLIRYAADAVMMKRMFNEHRAPARVDVAA